MIRCLMCPFQRLLILRKLAPICQKIANPNYLNVQVQRSLFHTNHCVSYAFNLENRSTAVVTNSPLDTDAEVEYIIPYRKEQELYLPKQVLVDVINTRFRLTELEKKRLLNDETLNRVYRERVLLNSLHFLCQEGVNKRSFLDYSWLLTLEKTKLQSKLQMINSMPVLDINHFVAFLRLSVPRLRKLVTFLNREKNSIPHNNRLYYISKKLNTDPYVVSKFLSHRLFILEMPFEQLKRNLQHMIDYNVSPMNVLRDLWAFRYTPKAVQTRLERAKKAKKDKIMPWMVRCPETILQRSIKLTEDELAVLGEKTSVVEYVAERLQFNVNETKSIMDKHPQVLRVRVTKVKEVLDFLLDKAGFSRYEIAQVPRIICHGLETTKQRLEELKTYGCRPTSLVILCKSKREYEKFVQYWLSMQNKQKTNSNVDEKVEY